MVQISLPSAICPISTGNDSERRFLERRLCEVLNMERVIYTPPSGPPQGPGPNSAIYRIMGEAHIFRMMLDFYKELEKSEVRPLFPADMREASEKSAAFFISILGGPPLYAQTYGP